MSGDHDLPAGAPEQLDTMFLCNPAALRARIGGETLVVCGVARGATSVASYALHHLGYYLGDRLGSLNYEDQDFVHAIPGKSQLRKSLRDRVAFRDLVARRDAAHTRWGFKLPRALDYVPELADTLRAPVFLVCLRNPLSVARSMLEREELVKGGFPAALQAATAPFAAAAQLLARDDVPSVLVDMDRVTGRPAVFVAELAALFGLTGDIPAIADAIAQPGYKPRVSPRP